MTYAADAFFDFDKSVLKPEGKAKLDDLTGKVKDINLEVIIAVGHTDSVGSDAYNQKLSVKRAEAVKAYLVSKGIEKNRVYTEGKGKKKELDARISQIRAILDESKSDWEVMYLLAKKIQERAKARGITLVKSPQGMDVDFGTLYDRMTIDGAVSVCVRSITRTAPLPSAAAN